VPAQPLFCGATDQLTSSISPSITYQRGRGYQEAVRAGSSEESHEDAHSLGRAVGATAEKNKGCKKPTRLKCNFTNVQG
jgi:hypothetical protein